MSSAYDQSDPLSLLLATVRESTIERSQCQSLRDDLQGMLVLLILVTSDLEEMFR